MIPRTPGKLVVIGIGPIMCLCVLASGCSAPSQSNGIRQTLDAQRDAWNAGNIDTYMDGYVRTDKLTFSGGGKTTRGWVSTRDRYKTKYDTRAKMGTLDFSEVEITPLSDNAAMVLGRWRLTRADGSVIGGNYSLVMTRSAGRWLILHDHSSTDESMNKAASRPS